MNMAPPPIPSFIPKSAPFTPEQRTWLNGLFAGLFGLQDGVTPLSSADAGTLLAGLIDGTAAPSPEQIDEARMMGLLGTIPPCRSPNA